MTPQATWQPTWRRDRAVRDCVIGWHGAYSSPLWAMDVAVAARDREVAATLRAEIEALPLSAPGHAATVGMKRYRAGVLAILDDVLGGAE